MIVALAVLAIRLQSEGPQHIVTLASFVYLGQLFRIGLVSVSTKRVLILSRYGALSFQPQQSSSRSARRRGKRASAPTASRPTR